MKKIESAPSKAWRLLWSRNLHIFGVIILFFILLGGVTSGSAYTITFEGFDDSTPITDQYSGLGVTFSGATILTAGISLNEFEFPPSSGVNVLFDDGGPINISFSDPVQAFESYFTYAVPLTLEFFDSSDASVATITSAYSSNMALSGDPGSSPNELLGLTYLPGIAKITITGDLSGASFTMEDLTATPVPIPGSLWHFLSGLILIAGGAWRRLRA